MKYLEKKEKENKNKKIHGISDISNK